MVKFFKKMPIQSASKNAEDVEFIYCWWGNKVLTVYKSIKLYTQIPYDSVVPLLVIILEI